MIRLSSITKSYPKGKSTNKVLNDLDLEIDEKDMIAILGDSGSGKTSLMKIIGLLDTDHEGEYYYYNNEISQYSKSDIKKFKLEHIGFIYQNFNLIDDLNIQQNIALPLTYLRRSKNDINEKVDEIAEKLGIKDKLSEYPANLSGGEQQRVAIARALATDPEIVLCDEPTGNLDPTNTKIIMDLLTELNREGKCIILVTHDTGLIKYCNKVLKITNGKLFNV